MTAIATREGVREPHIVVPFEQADNETNTARLSFDNGLEKLVLGAGASQDEMLEATFTDPVPQVWTAENAVHVEYPLGSRLLRRMGPNGISLNSAAAWSIDVHGGMAHLDADLTGIDVRSIACYAGAAHSKLFLGRPTGPRVIRLSSVSDLRIERPADVPVRVEIAKSCTKFSLDDKYYGAVGNSLADATSGYASDGPGYLVVVSGSAERLTIA